MKVLTITVKDEFFKTIDICKIKLPDKGYYSFVIEDEKGLTETDKVRQ